MDDQRLDQDVVDRHARIERAERVLEDELQLAAEAVELLALQRQHVDLAAPVVEHDAAGALVGIGRQAAHEDLAERGLAAAAIRRPGPRHSPRSTSKLTSLTARTMRVVPPPTSCSNSVSALRIVKVLVRWRDLQHRRRRDRSRRSARRPRFCCSRWPVAGLDLADRQQPLARLHVEARHGVQQRLQIGMLRRRGRCRRRSPDSIDLAAIHHHDVVGDVGDHAEIVGDHQHRHAELGLQVLHQRRICAWMVTSSAVVGSSAISSAGRQTSAMAIMARWRRPPDSSNG